MKHLIPEGLSQISGAIIGSSMIAYQGATAALVPEGMTPAGIMAAAAGAFVYVLSTTEDAEDGGWLKYLLEIISVFVICFLTGYFLGPAIKGNIFLLGTIEGASFAAAVGGVGIIAAFQKLGGFIASRIGTIKIQPPSKKDE